MPDFGNKNILMRVNEEGGHFGSTENDVNLMHIVQEFAWLDFLMLNPMDDDGSNDIEILKTTKEQNK